MAKKKPNKGWWVSPPPEIKERILGRCEESMREPGVEICFILRDWFRQQEAAMMTELEAAEREETDE